MTSSLKLSPRNGEQSPSLSVSARSINSRPSEETKGSASAREKDAEVDAVDRQHLFGRSLRLFRRTGIPPEGFVTAPPDGHFAWLVLLGACLAGFTAVSLNVVVSVLMDELITIYGTTTSTISWSISICSGAGSVIAPIATAVINTYSCRSAVLIGGALFTIGLIAASFATNIEIFLGTFVVMAVGNSFCFTPLPVILSQYFRKYYGIAFGCLTASYSSSKLVLTPLFQMISAEYGAQGCLLVAGGFMCHIMVGALLFQPARWHAVLIPTFENKNATATDEEKKTNDNGCTKQPIDDATREPTVDTDGNNVGVKEKMDQNNLVIISGMRNGKDVTGNGNDVKEKKPLLTKSSTEVNMATGALTSVQRDRLMDRHGSDAGFNLASSMDLFHAVSVEAVCRPPPQLAPASVVVDGGATTNGKTNVAGQRRRGCVGWCISGLSGFCGSIDQSLWKESVFYLICGHSIFSIGTMVYGSVYMYPFGVDAGLLPMESAGLISSRSFGELAGRLLGPVAVTALKLDARYSFIVVTVMHGISLIALTYMQGVTNLIAVGGFCGVLFGAAVGLTMGLIVESVGVKRLASTLGLTAFVYSPFMLALGPILGAVKDLTGTYRSCMLILAGMQFLNAILWILKPVIVRKKLT